MVIELRIKNFLSFKEETTISFEASKDTFKEDSLLVTMADGTRLSRIAIIYGANASGKSNLLEAFEYLFWFWKRKTDDQDAPTGVEPFILDSDTPSQPTEFELKLYINGKNTFINLFCHQRTSFQRNYMSTTVTNHHSSCIANWLTVTLH